MVFLLLNSMLGLMKNIKRDKHTTLYRKTEPEVYYQRETMFFTHLEN